MGIPYLKVGNKTDRAPEALRTQLAHEDFILISASNKTNIDKLKERILARFHVADVKQGMSSY